jgi:Flp pilus assembly protein TadD
MLRAVNRQFVDGDLEAALAEYELICELFPDNMAATNNRGRILTALGRYDEAVVMFERAAELDPRSSVPLFNQWMLLVNQLRRPKAAEVVARRAMTLWPELPGFRTMLGWTLTIQGRLTEAGVEYRQALAVAPDHEYALPNLAFVLYGLGRFEEAEPLFARVLELVDAGTLPGDRQSAVCDLALAKVAVGRAGEADALVLEESKRMRSGSRGAALTSADYTGLAQLAAAVGRADEARRWLSQAEAFGIDGPEEFAGVAAVHAMLGERDAALRELERALAGSMRDPYFPLVLPAFHDLLEDPEFLALFGVDRIT